MNLVSLYTNELFDMHPNPRHISDYAGSTVLFKLKRTCVEINGLHISYFYGSASDRLDEWSQPCVHGQEDLKIVLESMGDCPQLKRANY